MARLNERSLMKRMKRAIARKELWRSHLNDAYSLALPNRNLFENFMGDTRQQQRGKAKQDLVFDGTLMRSTIKTANRMQSDLTPPFHKWADLEPGPFIPAKQHESARKQLAPIRDAVFAAIHMSNFDVVSNEFYLDLLSGMGIMMVLENDVPGEAPVNYVAIPRAQVAIEEGPLGSVQATYRVHHVHITDIEGTFGRHFKAPDGWDKHVEDNKDKEQDEELREAIYFDPKENQYHYDVMWKGSTGSSAGAREESWARIVERDLEDTPFIVARWMKVAGEAEGRGPILSALPDAKTANKVLEFILRGAAFAVSGVWMARNDGVINPNTVRVIPGAIIPVGSTGGALGASIEHLEFKGRLDVAQIVLEDQRMAIKEAMLDRGLPVESGAVRSATEIIARMRELVQDIGSPFGRLMTEYLRPVLQKTINVLIRKGMIDVGGPVEINGGHIMMSITSPLAREQDLNDVEAVVQWGQITNAIVGPQMAQLGIKTEDVPEYLAQKLNVDPRLVRSEQERRVLSKNIGSMIGASIANGQTSPIGAASAIANDPGRPQRLAA